MSQLEVETDVLVIGAGPGGSASGAILAQAGHRVLCLERSQFPRHMIGESLLPRCNQLLAQAGLLEAVQSRGYIRKHGAIFRSGDRLKRFTFADGLPGDPPFTYQVPRDDFDQTLATEAEKLGVEFRFEHQVNGVEFSPDWVRVSAEDPKGKTLNVTARWVLDCSGQGRLIPRLLGLQPPPQSTPVRMACFTQVQGDVRPEGAEEGDIWVCTHPENGWIWIIPFSNGNTSIGFVCDEAHWESMVGTDVERLFTSLQAEPTAWARLGSAKVAMPIRTVRAFSQKATGWHGDRWALVGNAAGFLDPIFSSGVSLALESAVLAAGLVGRELAGERVVWAQDYDSIMDRSVDVFRAFVESWYRGDLEEIFFHDEQPDHYRRSITSILAGQVQRRENPLVRAPGPTLDRLMYLITKPK